MLWWLIYITVKCSQQWNLIIILLKIIYFEIELISWIVFKFEYKDQNGMSLR